MSTQKKKPVQTVQVVDFKRAPRIYESSIPGRILDLAKLGLTISEMAGAIGVKVGTLETWLHAKEEVREAYEKGRWIHDHAVELSLMQRALGFDYWEEKHVDGVDAIGRPYSYTTRVKKKVLADTTAQIFWLKNRSSDRWRDTYKPSEMHLTQVNNVNFEAMSSDELDLLWSAGIKQLTGGKRINGSGTN